MYSENTINTTVGKATHTTWKNISKANGLTMKNMFSLLVAREASNLGIRVPKELKNLLNQWEEFN